MKNFVLIFLFYTLSLNAQVEFPILKNYANDYTATLKTSEISLLNNKLKSFDDSTSNQIVFLMISTLNGYPIEMYAYEVASRNKIGTAKNNNGVLFLVVKDDRKMRIEVGYGLEGALPDALASSILRNEVRPYFKRGDYFHGIEAGIDAIISATKGEYKGDKKDKEEDDIKFPFIYIIMILLFLLLSRGGRRSGGILPWLIIGSMGGGRSRGWGGGGFSGGGFGGFSGGGGSFGGGGASGSW
ncbi:TPM domain-containing protein [Rosettibacter firmus]|uniref:TPM domain-containing protein n=1 Tax=Rosettibacter firmus TaxID=3111522 RepID=UPI00336BEF26